MTMGVLLVWLVWGVRSASVGGNSNTWLRSGSRINTTAATGSPGVTIAVAKTAVTTDASATTIMLMGPPNLQLKVTIMKMYLRLQSL